MSERPKYPTDEWTKAVCKTGQGELTCRYLTMGPNGWSCEKFGSLREHLDRRVANEEMNARGDNCEGLGSR